MASRDKSAASQGHTSALYGQSFSGGIQGYRGYTWYPRLYAASGGVITLRITSLASASRSFEQKFSLADTVVRSWAPFIGGRQSRQARWRDDPPGHVASS